VALLRQLAPPGRADDVVGDLHEMHGRRVRRRGPLIANTLTAFEALDMALALFRHRRRDTITTLRGPDPGLSGNRNGRRWQMRRWLEAWRRDFTYAARTLRRAPGFAAVIVATLALAIGANTAIFSVVDAVLIDPLPFPNADRLVSIQASAPGTDMPPEFGVSWEFFVQYDENADLLEDLGFFGGGQTTVRTEDRTDRLFVMGVSPSFFSTLGVTPVLGRLPTPEDPEGQVVLLSHALWTSWFGSDPSVIDQSIEVGGARRTVIGVMGPEFRFVDNRISVWVHDLLANLENRTPGNFGLSVIGRMRPGVSQADLTDQLAVLASRLPERFGGSPRYARIIEAHRPVVRSLEEQAVGDLATPLWLLLGTVAVVLLIACANVANLLTARAEGRRRDLAVRQALGAGRAGVIRSQMAEALLLAAVAGPVGAVLAWAGLPLVVRAAPENVPNLDLTRFDAAALGFTAGLSILAACVFGLVPAIRFSRPRLLGALRQAGPWRDAGSHWTRNALVLVQTAAALVLLVGSGLLLRSFWRLSHVDPGYDTENIFSFQIAPDRPELNDGPSYARFHEAFMERVRGLPGIESVGLTLALPLDEGAGRNRFTTERTAVSGETPPPMRFTFVGGDYFKTMGIELVEGRLFEPNDHRDGLGNAIVSPAAAAQLWPGEDPIGKRIAISADTTHWQTVVGVVEDIFVEDFRQDAPDPMIYLPMVGPHPQWVVGSPAYVVKSPRAGMLAEEIRNLAHEVAPESPFYRVFTMEGLAARSMAQLSFTMLMLIMAAGLSLVLGAVGLYGVLSYVVTHRAPEIALRMALGAEAERVRRMVVLQGARVTLAGVGIGLVAALVSTRVLESLLFGVGSLDVVTLIAMSSVMVVVALLASYIPARRASLVDPMDSLRAE
jgi:putative ABC transport system permease protein